MPTPANSVNISSAGIVGFTGTAFNETAVTQHSLLVGGATSSTLNNLGVATNGQLPIGSSGADPVLGNITSSSSTLLITNGAGTIDVETQVVLQTDTGWGTFSGAPPYYNAATLGTFTLLSAGTGFINGVPVSWAQPQSATGLTAGNTYYIYIDSTGTIGSTPTRTDALFANYIVLFECMRDSTSPANLQVITRENHPYNYPVNVSNFIHDSVGAVIENDSNGANITLVGTTGIGISGADTLADHGLITAISDSGGVAVTWKIYYTLAGGKWAQYSSTNAFPNYYNNGGTPTVLTGGQCVIFTLYVTKDTGNSSTPQYFAVMDTAPYANLTAATTALAAGSNAKSTNELQQLELCQLGYIVYQNGTGIVTVVISKATMRATTAVTGSNQASFIDTNTTAFTHWLSSSDTNVQQALNDLDAVGANVSPQYAVLTAGASYSFNAVSPSATSGVPLVSKGSSAYPAFDTATVPGGGTGSTSFTAYGPVVAASTTTGALTSIAPNATSGIPFISQGVSANPTFGTAVVAGGGTGAASFTTNGVVVSGTSATAALSALALTNGQLVIGSTGATPVASALTAGTGISITNAAGAITIAVSAGNSSQDYTQVFLLGGM
jgi:hypothetical protein